MTTGVETLEDDKKPRSRWITRLLALMLVVVLSAFTISPAYAYNLAMIQVTADPDTWQILSGVVTYDVGVLSGPSIELKRMGVLDLQELANGSADMSNATTKLSDLSTYAANYDAGGEAFKAAGTGDKEDNRILSFPGMQKGLTRIFEPSSSTSDMQKAQTVNDTLIADLNAAFGIWMDAKGYTREYSLSAYLTKMIEFLGEANGHVSGDKVVWDLDGNQYEFTWRLEKGYSGSRDTQYINWAMVAYEAFNNAVLDGDIAVTPQNVYDSEPGQLTKALVGFFSNLLDTIRGLLGLWSMDELIFNAGWRGSGYIGGAFPKSWEPHIWGLFAVMEIFAAMIVMFGILNTIKKNVQGAINPIQKEKAMEKVQDVAVAGIALVILPIALNLVLSMSANVTAIIYDVLVPAGRDGKRTVSEAVSRYASASGSLVGVIGQFMFMAIQISFNFMYALRALTIAVLIIIAPIMVAMMIVSDSKKQATMSWMKELLAQICIQPIHAFCLSVILVLPTSTHAFDNILALYALIPFSSLIKSFFFGSAGSWSEQLADRAKSRLTGALGGAAVAGVGVATGAVANKIGEKLDGNKGGDVPDGNATKQGNANASGGSNNATSMADAVPDDGDRGGETGGNVADHAAAGSAGTGGSGGALLQSARGPAHAGTGPSLGRAVASGEAKPKSKAGEKVANVGKKVFTVAGGAALAAGSIAGGVALSAAGGALNGAGIKGDMNKHLAYVGERVVRRGTGKGISIAKSAFEKDAGASGKDSEMPDAADSLRANGYEAGFTGGTEVAPDLSTYDDDKAVTQEWSKEQLAADGITDIQDDRDNLTMKVAADSNFGQSLGKIAEQTSTLTPAQQVQFAKDTGVSITKNKDGSYGVNINKKRYSAANDGAKISYTENRQGKGTMRMTNKESHGTPGGLISSKAMKSAVVVGAIAGAQSQQLDDGNTRWTVPANELTPFQRRTLENTAGVRKETNEDGKVVGYSMVTAGDTPPEIKPNDEEGGTPLIHENAPAAPQSEPAAPSQENAETAEAESGAGAQTSPEPAQMPAQEENPSQVPPAIGLTGGAVIASNTPNDEDQTVRREWTADQLSNMGIRRVESQALRLQMTVDPNSEFGRSLAPTVERVQQMTPAMRSKFENETGISFRATDDKLEVSIHQFAYSDANGGTRVTMGRSSVDGSRALIMTSKDPAGPSGSILQGSAIDGSVNVAALQDVSTVPMANGGQQITIPESSLTAFQQLTLASDPHVKPVMSRNSNGEEYVSAYQYETNGNAVPDYPVSPAPSGVSAANIGGSPVSMGAARSKLSDQPGQENVEPAGGITGELTEIDVDTSMESYTPVTDPVELSGTDESPDILPAEPSTSPTVQDVPHSQGPAPTPRKSNSAPVGELHVVTNKGPQPALDHLPTDDGEQGRAKDVDPGFVGKRMPNGPAKGASLDLTMDQTAADGKKGNGYSQGGQGSDSSEDNERNGGKDNNRGNNGANVRPVGLTFD